MDDGIYSIDVTLSGGTGKAYLLSPAQLTVESGEMTARVEWSSSKYDLMIVDGKEYLPVNESGNSVFEIPVAKLDEPLSVQAETVAMSEPHLIDYEIGFDTGSIKLQTGQSPVFVIAGCGAALCALAVGAFAALRHGKKKND